MMSFGELRCWSQVLILTSMETHEISLAGHATLILSLCDFSAWEAQPKASGGGWTISPASAYPSIVTPHL